MYIIEKLIKLYLKTKEKHTSINIDMNSDEEILEDVLTCKHTFMPIDSTKKIFACSKCGYVATIEWIKKQNKLDTRDVD